MFVYLKSAYSLTTFTNEFDARVNTQRDLFSLTLRLQTTVFS